MGTGGLESGTATTRVVSVGLLSRVTACVLRVFSFTGYNLHLDTPNRNTVIQCLGLFITTQVNEKPSPYRPGYYWNCL